MAVSDTEDGMHTLFAPMLPKHIIVDLPRSDDDFAALRSMLERKAETMAGIIVEPLVQGAGGMKFHDAAVLERLRALADKYDMLLIFDEVFTGFGRTGTMFACEAAGVVPDIIALSKALTGGTLPLAATVATKKVFDAFWSDHPDDALMHGPSYHGQRARLRRRQCLARSVRARAAVAAGRGHRFRVVARPRTLPRHAPASRTCA